LWAMPSNTYVSFASARNCRAWNSVCWSFARSVAFAIRASYRICPGEAGPAVGPAWPEVLRPDAAVAADRGEDVRPVRAGRLVRDVRDQVRVRDLYRHGDITA
jgi:hypothetical protein